MHSATSTPGRRITTPHERRTIRALAAQGHSDPQIAAQVGWSVATVRKWRRCAQPERLQRSLFGRPVRGPLSACGPQPERWREQVRAWRRAHPGWGPKTLRAEFARHPAWATTPLPSRTTLARFLKADGWIPARPRTVIEPARARPAPQAPHEAWQLDARGPSEIPDLGVVALVHLNDVASHAGLLSYPFLLGPGPAGRQHRHLQLADYQLALRLAFLDWGLPDRLQVDHETAFCDPDSTSPYPTRWHLWLLALGVELCFTRVHRPTDQGLTERSHQLWEAQALRGQTFASGPALVRALRERREFLNWHLPCRSLDEQPPLVAYPTAKCPAAAIAPSRSAAYWIHGGSGRIWQANHGSGPSVRRGPSGLATRCIA